MNVKPEIDELRAIIEWLDRRVVESDNLRAREITLDTLLHVQRKLAEISATPKKSLLVAGNIPAGCACPFAKSIPCTMQMTKCPTEGKTLAFSFSCALARGFDLAEQEKNE